MKFETLKKDNKKKIAIGIIAVISITLVGVLAGSFAKYKLTESIPLVDSTINYTVPDLNIIAIYQENEAGEYDLVDDMPTDGYTFSNESYCATIGENGQFTKDTNITINYDMNTKTITAGPTTKRTRCYLYFDKIRDTEKPVVSKIEATEVTKTSITVKVTATDNTGVTKYLYSINNGTYTEKTTNTHTFSGLTKGTSYTISVKVKDAEGNESDVKTETIATENDTASDTILGGVTINKTTPDFNKVSGGYEISTPKTTLTYVYADNYEYDEASKTYSLVNPQSCNYLNCYNNLKGKYVKSPWGGTSSDSFYTTNLDTVYFVDDITSNSINYYNIGYTEFNPGIYELIDDTGKSSYYYRGAVTNNYLKFANKWWRIIRINGDGTIRIIYDGTEYHANGTGGLGAFINNTTYEFSDGSTRNKNAYVGFMYGSTSYSATYKQTHENVNKSYAMIQLETWYENNLLEYTNKIDINAGFCGDRSLSSGTGAGDEFTDYGGTYRLIDNKMPTLKCPQDNDLYTIKESANGNRALTYPIGLITADEVSLSGGKNDMTNLKYYLQNESAYWTMTPKEQASYTYIFYVGARGALSDGSGITAFSKIGLRPVINLRADVQITGSGTGEDPYVVN